MTLETWERRTGWPLTALAVIFLGCYAWPILEPDLDSSTVSALSTLSLVIWVAFGVDYVASVYLSADRVRYVRRHLLDLVMLVLPMLRPLRALRALVALSRVNRKASTSFHGRAVVYIAGAVPLVVFVAALATLDAERADPEANIASFADAMWWGSTTISTVGYGDRFPITGEGRLIAVALMLAGIALLGVVTAALASWFVEKIGDVEAAEEDTQRDVEALVDEVRALRADLRESRPPNA